MGIMSKIKDLFTDVEEIDEEEEVVVPKKKKVEEKTEEPVFKLPTVMREDIESENNTPSETLELNKNIKPREEEEYKEMIPRSRVDMHNYNFDIDFENIKPSEQNVLNTPQEKPKKVSEIYADPKKDKKGSKNERRFAPSPVISPVYGVLDKNYKTDELLSKSENSYEMQRHSKKVDFETVRRKAFGNLTEDIKNNLCEDCELFKEVKRLEKLNEEELLYDMTEDSMLKKDVTVEEAYDNYSDFGVEYEVNRESKIKENEEVKIVNHNDNLPDSEKIEFNDKAHEELTDDLFDLIDSMYNKGDE